MSMFKREETMYFWWKIGRVADKSPSHQFFASTGTDAETTGRFTDSVTRVGFSTVYGHQSKHEVFEKYQQQVIADAQSLGFDNVQVVSITRREYDAFYRGESIACELFHNTYSEPAYTGERMIRK